MLVEFHYTVLVGSYEVLLVKLLHRECGVLTTESILNAFGIQVDIGGYFLDPLTH